MKKELNLFIKNFKHLDRKIVTIFLSSIVIFTLSWYFANPNFFLTQFSFVDNYAQTSQDCFSFGYWFVADVFLFLIVPLLITKFYFRENIKEYGINLKNKKIGFTYVFISILFFLPIIIIISNSENFNEYFPLMQSAKSDLRIFIFYELFLLMFIFSWEFILRGFLLFGLEKKFGFYSIFIQLIPFVLLHNGKPFIETFASIAGGIFLGYLALRTRSFFYGFLIHVIILILLDILSLV
ncbi:MAG: hypothetical protein CR986_07115 [Ignavibacteriae bacterium]|nr:MAG: hypothetical protein CR986_07115 [Ignavibacteriota bacterium]